ncbi:hypothetical protein FRX31_008755, partial [Thalictrum thalictroides]
MTSSERAARARKAKTVRVADIGVENNMNPTLEAGTSRPSSPEQVPAWATNLTRMIEMTNRRLDVLEDAGRVVPPRPPVVNLNTQPQVNHAAPNGQEVPVDFVAAQDNETWRRMVEGFMKMKPPKFSGSTDVTVVEDWNEDIENLFDAMG